MDVKVSHLQGVSLACLLSSCWLLAEDHRDFSIGLLEWPHDMTGGFPPVRDQREIKLQVVMSFMIDLTSDIILHHFCNIRLAPFIVGGDYIGQELVGTSSKAGVHWHTSLPMLSSSLLFILKPAYTYYIVTKIL